MNNNIQVSWIPRDNNLAGKLLEKRNQKINDSFKKNPNHLKGKRNGRYWKKRFGRKKWRKQALHERRLQEMNELGIKGEFIVEGRQCQK
jgi:hypothetical protein